MLYLWHIIDCQIDHLLQEGGQVPLPLTHKARMHTPCCERMSTIWKDRYFHVHMCSMVLATVAAVALMADLRCGRSQMRQIGLPLLAQHSMKHFEFVESSVHCPALADHGHGLRGS